MISFVVGVVEVEIFGEGFDAFDLGEDNWEGGGDSEEADSSQPFLFSCPPERLYESEGDEDVCECVVLHLVSSSDLL